MPPRVRRSGGPLPVTEARASTGFPDHSIRYGRHGWGSWLRTSVGQLWTRALLAFRLQAHTASERSLWNCASRFPLPPSPFPQ
jgi:hypothetical protein